MKATKPEFLGVAMFPFLDFCSDTKKSFEKINNLHPKCIKDFEDHINLKNYFILNFLMMFLPTTIDIGAGKVVDFSGRTSSIQDIILYRSNYPIFRSFDTDYTYLLESVVATIKILPGNNPLDLRQSFINNASVKNLKPAKHRILANNSQDYMELKLRTVPKTFIFSFCNSIDQTEFVRLYQTAQKGTMGIVPDGVYIQSDPAIYAQYDSVTQQTTFVTKNPFIHFFQHIFNIVMSEVNPSIHVPAINASIHFDFSSYFSDLDKQLIENI